MHRRDVLAAASASAAVILMATSLVACQGTVACPAIAAAPFVTLHIAPELSTTLDPGSVTATACQDGACHGGPLPLRDEPSPGRAAAGKVGNINLGILTETPIDLTVSGSDLQGRQSRPLRLQFAPRVSYPFGHSCPRVITAAVLWEPTGLHPSAQ